ncbi:hypothetical protein [Streptomyces sp. NPDC058457]|uniref:hypothetical protein n=1 Tax=Streptomyces sp. NPDC058457 TaxID=3346507 RepID=UPI00365124D0
MSETATGPVGTTGRHRRAPPGTGGHRPAAAGPVCHGTPGTGRLGTPDGGTPDGDMTRHT